jgi:hypothetical protein
LDLTELTDDPFGSTRWNKLYDVVPPAAPPVVLG